MKKIIHLTALVVLSLVLVACGRGPQATKDRLQLVTTFYPVYEFTKQVVGEEGDVQLLIEAGTEVHDFEPSAKDIARIQEADAFVYASDYMETWVPSVVDSLVNENLQVIEATEKMLLLPGTEDDHAHDQDEEHGHDHAYDPHVWLSPERAVQLLAAIADQLGQAYPEKKAAFERNAAAYRTKLEELDHRYRAVLGAAKQKAIVTQHAAFAYLALDYGLEQVAITGLSADEEPSPARLAQLVDYIKQYGIRVIYVEENASPVLAQTLARETGVELAVLDTLESLTNQATKNGENYLSLMGNNLKALEKTTSQEGKTIEPETGKETSQTVYNGYFEDKAVKDRSLNDYAGDWQSVYPYLVDGTLDQVFDYKAKKKGGMSAQEYKAYYDKGYKTDVSRIRIKDQSIEFFVGDQSSTYTYRYVGYKIVTYKKGNRGVRFLFEAVDSNAGNYRYVQFSDHNIAPIKTGHFHIFFGGESQEKLLDEMENWPTYYPAGLSGLEIGQEMLAH